MHWIYWIGLFLVLGALITILRDQLPPWWSGFWVATGRRDRFRVRMGGLPLIRRRWDERFRRWVERLNLPEEEKALLLATGRAPRAQSEREIRDYLGDITIGRQDEREAMLRICWYLQPEAIEALDRLGGQGRQNLAEALRALERTG